MGKKEKNVAKAEALIERAETALEEGELLEAHEGWHRALALLRALPLRGAEEPALLWDSLMTCGELSLELGDATAALALFTEAHALDTSEGEPKGAPIEGPAEGEEARSGMGRALFELCRFDEARALFVGLCNSESEGPTASFYLGLLAERRGERGDARLHFERAARLDPERYPLPIELSQREFDAALRAAIERLPEQVRAWLTNVTISVMELPLEEELLGGEEPLSPQSLGLFRGNPVTERSTSDPWSCFPSAIFLFQRNLQRFARSREELIDEIGVTLLHEVGHFLGLDEEALAERGLD